MIRKFIICFFFIISSGCATLVDLTVQTVAGAIGGTIGNMVDRRIEEKEKEKEVNNEIKNDKEIK